MSELRLRPELALRLARIYQEMEAEYQEVAERITLSCEGCPDNCCDSYFQHHTYAEWAYLRQGFQALPAERQAAILARCRDYSQACEAALARGERPQVMCPLNEEGLCILYRYRMMVCRTHGVPASMRRPDGRQLLFPGCFRCQELVEQRYPNEAEVPRVERTRLLRELVLLEDELLEGRRHLLPKVKLTIAQMLEQAPLPGEDG